MRRTICMILTAAAVLTLTGCGGGYDTYRLYPNEFLLGESVSDSGEVVARSSTGDEYPQLSEEDIQAMNGWKARFVYSDEGYVTFLQGRFCEDKIEDYEQAVAALQSVSGLIGLGAGSEFFCVSGSQDDDGYTYYTFQQRYGDVTVMYATLRVVVDPDGYTAGLSSSFVPNLGIAPVSQSIEKEQAEEIVRQQFPDIALEYYTEQTHKVAVTIEGVSYRAWVVYTSNPNTTAGDWGMQYFEHFVAVDGTYLYRLPVASFESSNTDAFQPQKYFDKLERQMVSYEAVRYDGSTETLTVPVSYNPATGRYYLMDPERLIAVGDFYTVVYGGDMDFISSDDPSVWRNGDVLAYDRYIKAYDFYAGLGLYSVDGSGLPILVCVGYCDFNGLPVDNAGYCGVKYGWAIFGASDVNYFSEAVDVVGHEFTHGVTSSSAVGSYYANASGAINEAYSDIMGNLCEMMGGYTSDTEWLVGENSGYIFRSMSSPTDYKQPVKLGGTYYMPPTDTPSAEENDLGGVHQNSSLLAQMAYILYKAGMSLDEERSLWLTSIELLTPTVGYKEVHAALLMSVDINGFDARYKDVLTEAFRAADMI